MKHVSRTVSSLASQTNPVPRRRVLLVLVGLVIAVPSAIAVRAFSTRKPAVSIEDVRLERAVAVTNTTAVSTQASTDDLQAKLITLTQRGFEPDEIVVKQKSFLLAIENRSRLDDVAVHLSRVTGARLHDVSMPRSKTLWNDVFALPPGDYMLTEENHPGWVCTIVVRAQ